MAVCLLVKYGNPILRKVMKPVKDFSTLPGVVQDMFDTMYELEGIGLAANQIRQDLNVMVIDLTHTDEWDEPKVFVNSRILKRWGESEMEEGCLSLPGIRVNVRRSEGIKFSYQNMEGEKFEQDFEGLMARVIQHEVDHLNGILIIDRVSSLMLSGLKKQLEAIAAETPSV